MGPGGGPTCGADKASIAAHLAPYNLRVVEAGNSGDCQFQSISVCLEGHNNLSSELREIAVNAICSQPEKYSPFIVDASVDEYVSDMSRKGSWGDQLTLQALVDCSGCPAMVYSTDDSANVRVLKLSPATPTDLDPIHLAYVGGMHYCAVVSSSTSPIDMDALLDTTTILEANPPSVSLPKRDQFDAPRNARPRAGNTLTFASINVTALYPHLDSVLEMDVDVVGIQETSLTAAVQEEVDIGLTKGDWAPVWGAPVEGARSKHVKTGDITRGRNGGVAMLCRRPCVLRRCTTFDDVLDKFYRAGRLVHSFVATGDGKKGINVFTVYAKSGGAQEDFRYREELLQTLLLDLPRRLGNVPAIVLGDLNTDVSRSPALRKALSSTWVDGAALAAALLGEEPPPTYTGTINSTRIDYVLLNTWAAQALTASKTFRVPGVCKHSCVSVTLNFDAFQQKSLRYQLPRAIPPPASGSTTKIPMPCRKRFMDLVQQDDVDGAWREMCKLCETYLLSCSGSSDQRYRGRGIDRAPTKQPMCAKVSPDTGYGMCTLESRLDKVGSRLTHITRRLRHLNGLGTPYTVSVEDERCWNKCRRLLSGFTSSELCVNPSKELPNLDEAMRLCSLVSAYKTALRAKRCMAKRSSYRKSIADKFLRDYKGLTAWLSPKASTTTDAVTRPDGSLTANVEEMDAILTEAWDPILRMYNETDNPEPDFGPFMARFGDHVTKHPMELSDVTGDELRAVLMQKKKSSGACGIDGWRIDELQRLPVPLLQLFAELFNLIERTSCWPQGLLTALVTLIPKGDSGAPLDLRPITVTSAVYRLWACRRLKDIVRWQDGWLLPSQRGFRTGGSTDDVLLDITSAIEETLLNDELELYLVALDFQKCFDRVPQKLVLALAKSMGMHARVLDPLTSMYSHLRRRFKLPNGVGQEFMVTNGILQGCPISAMLINALLAVVLSVILNEVSGTSSSSYADDVTIMSDTSETHIQEAVTILTEFCHLTGMRLHPSKTVVMGIVQGTLKHRAKNPYVGTVLLDGSKLNTVSSQVFVGTPVGTLYNSNCRSNKTRMESIVPACDKLSTSPLPHAHRASLASVALVPKAVYGCPYTTTSAASTNSLCTSLTNGVFGKKHKTRNPIAVLSIANKGHLLDPVTVIRYSSLRNLFAGAVKLPYLVPRLNRILELRQKESRVPLDTGPIGLAMERAGESFRWGTVLAESRTAGHDECLLSLNTMKRNHELRVHVRCKRWEELAIARPSYEGIENGIDTKRTNATRLAKGNTDLSNALTAVISGGVYRANQRPTILAPTANDSDACDDESDTGDGATDSSEADSSSDYDCDSSDDKAVGTLAHSSHCPHCEAQEEDTNEHIFWRCSAFNEIRSDARFNAITSADRTSWKPCLVNWGVVPLNCKVDVSALHTLMGSIILERWRLNRVKFLKEAARLPWDKAAVTPTIPITFDWSKLPSTPPSSWKYGLVRHTAFLEWLKSLEFVDDNKSSISNIELGIDFEVFSGLLLQHERAPDNTGWSARERGKAMGIWLRWFRKHCTNLRITCPLPGNSVTTVYSLRPIGAPQVAGGHSPRARLGVDSIAVIRSQLSRSVRWLADAVWGTAPLDAYGPSISARASRWSSPPTSSADTSEGDMIDDVLATGDRPAENDVPPAEGDPEPNRSLKLKRSVSPPSRKQNPSTRTSKRKRSSSPKACDKTAKKRKKSAINAPPLRSATPI